jgi:hypothetical protein
MLFHELQMGTGIWFIGESEGDEMSYVGGGGGVNVLHSLFEYI